MWTCMRGNTAGHLGQRNKSSSVVSIRVCFWPLGSNTVFTADGLHAPHCSLLTQVPLLPPCYLQLTHTSHNANWQGWELTCAHQPWAHFSAAGEALTQLTWVFVNTIITASNANAGFTWLYSKGRLLWQIWESIYITFKNKSCLSSGRQNAAAQSAVMS